MPCFHPLDAWQCSNGDVVFTDNLARNDIIRRLALAARLLVQTGNSLRRWRLLRLAGLSDERLTSLADDLLRDVLGA